MRMRGRYLLLLSVIAISLAILFVLIPSASAQNATNEPPTAEIDSIYVPPKGKGDTVYFSGHGNDPDGEVVAYKWRSNVTGVLSRNQSFNRTNMTVGEHRIWFSVMDDNDTWSAEVKMDIVVGEHCSDCDDIQSDDEEHKDDTAVPDSSMAVVVTFVVVILTMTIWFNLTRKEDG